MGGIIRYDDMMGGAAASQGSAALTQEVYRDTPFVMPFFRHDRDESLNFTFQFCHRKKLGSNLASVHIHYVPMVNPGVIQNVYMGWQYSWQTIDGTYPLSASWTSGNTTIPIGTTDAFKHKVYSLTTNVVPPASEGYSSIMLFYLVRLGTNILDTYNTNKVTPPGTPAANFGLLFVDCHYQTERRGSLTEFSG